jgi:hypothetical protein
MATDRIPTELWMTILRFATETEEWNEHLITLVPDFKSRHRSERVFFSERTLREAMVTRRHVVLVCKSWYDMCLPVLWSHLIISVEDWLKKLPLISDLLDSRPELGSFVVRLVIRYGRILSYGCLYKIEKLNQFLHIHLFPRLHRLRALYAPPMHATGNFNINPEIVVLDPGGSYPGYEDCITRPRFWRNARILQVELDSCQVSESPVPVMFPCLIRLRITILDDDGIAIKNIVSL